MEVSPELSERFYSIAQGFAGAQRVMADLIKRHGVAVLRLFEEQDIRGQDIWVLYADVCDSDLQATYETLQSNTAREEIKNILKQAP